MSAKDKQWLDSEDEFYDDDEDEDDDWSDVFNMPKVCVICGGPYPLCEDGCKLMDD